MNKIIYIGMDVHSTNFTLCSFEPRYGIEADKIFGQTQIKEDIFNSTVKYINKLKSIRPDVDVICGYEAGCLGYNLHRKLKAKEIESVILAPTTMAVSRNSSKKKNDYRDAVTIAKCLASSAYKAVYIPDEKDEDIRDFIRMRDDHKTALKQIKQQLNAFCLRHGHHYDKTKWTGLHLNWLRKLELSKVQRETVEEYLATYEYITDDPQEFNLINQYSEDFKSNYLYITLSDYCLNDKGYLKPMSVKEVLAKIKSKNIKD